MIRECLSCRIATMIRSASTGILFLLVINCTHFPPDDPPQEFAASGYTNFETGPVKPLAISSDQRYLFVLNTADDRLEIFDTRGERLRSIGETAVGLRPVSLALRNDKELWVANHLSDSVSVVDVSVPERPRLLHTLSVGDEPRGICVAGLNRERIFVATARRDSNLTPGIGRALLWIFDANRSEAKPQIMSLFGTKPRALTASSDGRFVYAGIFLSGNRTTTISGEAAVQLGRIPQFPRTTLFRASAKPKFGPIVAQTPSGWQDHKGEDWSPAIPFDLPDYDVFVIDATAANPVVTDCISGVGTILFNLAVQPGSEELWVTNTEALNLIPTEPVLRSKFAASRVTRIALQSDGENRIRTLSLNPHLDAAVTRGIPVDSSLSLASQQISFSILMAVKRT